MSEAAMSNGDECVWAIRVGADRWIWQCRSFGSWRGRNRFLERDAALAELRMWRELRPETRFTLVTITRMVKPEVVRVQWEVRGDATKLIGVSVPINVVFNSEQDARSYAGDDKTKRVVKVTTRQAKPKSAKSGGAS